MTSPPQPQQIYYGPHSQQNQYTVAYSVEQGETTIQQQTLQKNANMPSPWG